MNNTKFVYSVIFSFHDNILENERFWKCIEHLTQLIHRQKENRQHHNNNWKQCQQLLKLTESLDNLKSQSRLACLKNNGSVVYLEIIEYVADQKDH